MNDNEVNNSDSELHHEEIVPRSSVDDLLFSNKIDFNGIERRKGRRCISASSTSNYGLRNCTFSKGTSGPLRETLLL